MNKLTVYAIPVSLYCAKLRILLRHKKLEWQELPPPGGYGSDEYAWIVPSGNLPALVDGDLLLSDSEAIAEYLNEKHPAYPLLPEGLAARAKARELSRFHDTRLEPELRALFAQITSDKRDNDFVSKQAEKLSLRLKELSQLLEGLVVTANNDVERTSFQHQLSLGDCGFAISFLWVEKLSHLMAFNIDWPDRVLDYRQHIASFSAVSSELADYQPKLDQWLETATQPAAAS